jgi:Uma2 family endonuclease
MASSRPLALEKIAYFEAAQAYLRSLPLEHFMESVRQSNQRKVSTVSLGLIAQKRPALQVFGELLVQYPGGRDTIRQVVPDNMVVVHPEPIQADGSYDVPHQPVGPFWVLEYVSRSNKRKDYETNFVKYERELKVPYYLIFYPDDQELSLYRRGARKYVSVKPNARERLDVPELEIEVALLDGWVRFWYQGELVPLPEDLQRDLEEMRRQLGTTRGQLDEARKELGAARGQLDEAQQEIARLRAELDRLRKP